MNITVVLIQRCINNTLLTYIIIQQSGTLGTWANISPLRLLFCAKGNYGSSFLVVAFSRLLILSVKLFFFSLTNEVVVVDEAEAEVNELERKEVDIVKVLRTGRELKVVRDLEPVIKDCFALCSSTVVVSTLEASLMNVTLSFEDDLLSMIGASEGLRLGSSGSLGT